MPEGPEIRRAADALGAALIERPLTTLWFHRADLRRRGKALAGRPIVAVRPWGKAMLTEFEGGWQLYSHNQLYGRWMIVPSGTRPETKRSLRVVLENVEDAALLYSASDIAILAPGEWQSHPFLSRLGPDIFHADTTPVRLRARLADRRFARKPVGALLMHQPFVAGLGNYLRSEILFAARLHPARRAGELDADAAGRLSRAMTQLAERAYRTGGETASKSWVKARRRAGEGWQQARHWVFNREELPCPECEAPIRRITFDGRRLYLCPHCQQEPAS